MRRAVFTFAVFAIVILAAVFGFGVVKLSAYDKLGVSQKLETKLSKKDLTLGSSIFIRIFKENRELELWVRHSNGKYVLFESYPICYYSGDLGPKQKEGDMQSPEGFYTVSKSQLNPYSSYHLSFNLGYPNKYDQAHGRTGSYLMVHGNCVSIGCYAMTDKKIEEIYTLAESALNNGQKSFYVHAFPFRMTDENMRKHLSSEWMDFWKNLKQGYDAFKETKIPPTIKIKNKTYHME